MFIWILISRTQNVNQLLPLIAGILMLSLYKIMETFYKIAKKKPLQNTCLFMSSLLFILGCLKTLDSSPWFNK